ncbi:MAG TPA: hypothetical protein VM755_20290 [Stellaceae bacterium]|nr:hypothetical protein [Stellaceae bacterium]
MDCKHARLPAQQVACSSPELLQVLAERDRVFAQARARLKGKDLAALVADERDWIKSYPKSCGVPAKGTLPHPIPKATIACFKRASEQRIGYLRQYGRPKSAAAPSAPAPGAPQALPPVAPKPVEESALPPAAKPAPSQPAAEPAPSPAPPPAPPQPAAAPAASAQPQSPPAEKPAAPAVAAVPPGLAPQAPPPPAASPPPAAAPNPAAEYHLKFTFACSNASELPKVISSIAANDLSYPLSRPDCLPVPDGGKASLLSVSGDIAKIRMCTADVGCTDVYIDAKSVLDPEGRPVAK